MSNHYVNAAATKLLATACACCGRALVDAVSVETGIGPECRKRFALDTTVPAEIHDEANKLVHQVARRGVDRRECRAVCARLAALGFVALADRVLKRFHMVAEPAVDVQALRKEYAIYRAAHLYDNATAAEFDAECRRMGASSPAEFVAAAKVAACPCKRCNGTGRYQGRGAWQGKRACFRCDGKGRQNRADVQRNHAWDQAQAAKDSVRRLGGRADLLDAAFN